MLLIDANAILRYMLNDNNEMADKVRVLLENTKVTVRYEVMAEVVYVLNKVYSLPPNRIADGIKVFLSLQNVETESEEVLLLALQAYVEAKMDFVDCVLYGFRAVNGYDVFTFDKKLNTMMQKLP